jgi:polyisoprenyl-teichoic acid--peptidoglycan teichoic acid transferase
VLAPIPRDQEPALQYSSSATLNRSRDDGAGRGRRGGPPNRGGKGKKGKKGRRPKDPLWAKLLVIFGALLMLGSGTVIIGNKLIFAAATSSVTQADLGFGDPATTHMSINGAKNILLIGNDARPDQNLTTDPARADSIMVLHIPSAHDRAYLASIPRDTYVRIPAFDNGKVKLKAQQNKVNSAFFFGGQGGLSRQDSLKYGTLLLKQTLEVNFGLKFDAGAIVDFAGFKEVVNVLGGVDMYVDEKVTSIHVGFTKDGQQKVPFNQDANLGLHPIPGVNPQVYEVGPHHFTPAQALDYVRQRDLLGNGDSDYGRQRHQQQFIKAVFKEILKSGALTDPGKLKAILDVVGKAMTVDSGGIGLEDWIFAMRGVGAGDVVTIKTNAGQFNSEKIAGLGDVELMDQTSMQLMAAIHNDAIDGFIDQHPDWVSQS